MTPRLSIVIVNFNGGEHLATCLRSIEEHPLRTPAETVVVDNASTDGSADTVARFAWARLIQLPL